MYSYIYNLIAEFIENQYLNFILLEDPFLEKNYPNNYDVKNDNTDCNEAHSGPSVEVD